MELRQLFIAIIPYFGGILILKGLQPYKSRFLSRAYERYMKMAVQHPTIKIS